MTGRRNAPDLVPVLSRGRHRNPKKGACFMEMASYLAGERWSDHPSCTHPLLAVLARMVNDVLPDASRPRLAELIPDVIGLTSDDPRVDARLALHCATAALPIASAARQNVLAVGVLASERMLAALDGRPRNDVPLASRQVLDRVPLAKQWAEQFTGRSRMSPRAFRRAAGPHIIGLSVLGIGEAAVSDSDDRLIALLTACIAETRALVASSTSVTASPGGVDARSTHLERLEQVGLIRPIRARIR